MPFGWTHSFLRQITTWGLWGFFEDVRVINGHNVPKEGACIIVCTHHNMGVDAAVLTCIFPHKRKLHYWIKSSLFANPLVAKLLYNSGNICVNRRSKDNQELFKGTFEALAAGEIVALFPEGTSYTEPRITQVKDGASWAALEYMKWCKTQGKDVGAKEITIIPAGIVYTSKTKYRGTAIIEYGEPIQLAALTKKFMQSTEEGAKLAVKTLTKTIERNLVRLSVNADDWETVFAARMARELLWENEKDLKPEEYLNVSQMFSDMFTHSNECPSFLDTKFVLLKYYALLQASGLSNASLANLPLPKKLDPKTPAPLPSRLATVGPLLQSTLACLVGLPFFAIPFILHTPIYWFARYGASLSNIYDETQDQAKILFGFAATVIVYSMIFGTIWTLMFLTPIGFLAAAMTVVATAVYHVSLIDDNYTRAKQVLASWRILVGVWGPRSWDLPLSSLAQYTIVKTAPPNPWIDRPIKRKPSGSSASSTPSSETLVDSDASASAPVKVKVKAPSRSLIRHVLRARVDSYCAMARLMEELERISPTIPVSEHLGHHSTIGLAEQYDPASDTDYLTATLSGAEIVQYLRDRGAKIAELKKGHPGDWAAFRSGGSDASSPTLVGGDSPDSYVKIKAL